jgi:hypothetical protein
LGLFIFISDYLPYFEKKIKKFNIIAKTVWINLQGLIEIIFRFSTYENNLNFFKPIKTGIKWHMTLKLIYSHNSPILTCICWMFQVLCNKTPSFKQRRYLYLTCNVF